VGGAPKGFGDGAIQSSVVGSAGIAGGTAPIGYLMLAFGFALPMIICE
jgi:hypothetical protein